MRELSPACIISEGIRVRLMRAQLVERTAPWFLPAAEGMASFYAVLEGSCRIRAAAADEGVLLRNGDIAVLLHGRRHWLQNDRQNAGRTTIFRGRFRWSSHEANSFIAGLPEVVLFANENGSFVPWMSLFGSVIADDTGLNEPRVRVIMNQMAQTIFVQSISGQPQRL